MHSLLQLLLALCSSTAFHLESRDGTGKYHNDARSSIYQLLDRERRSDGQIQDLTYTDTQKILDIHRRKRALSSFSDALNAILSLTVGFTKIEVGGREMMLFVKVGSYADATRDFYSLSPVSVANLSPKVITGVVENHAVGLRSQPPTVYVLNGKKSKELLQWGSSNGEEKIIRYFDSVKEAKLAFSRWGASASSTFYVNGAD